MKSVADRDNKGRFLKGQSGNPSGRKPLAPEFREIQHHDKEWMIKNLDLLKFEPVRAVQELMNDPETPISIVCLCSAFIKAANGDHNCLRILLEYLVGKPVSKIEIENEFIDNTPRISSLQDIIDKMKSDPLFDSKMLSAKKETEK